MNKLNNTLTAKIETGKLHHEATRTKLNRGRHNPDAGTKLPKRTNLRGGFYAYQWYVGATSYPGVVWGWGSNSFDSGDVAAAKVKFGFTNDNEFTADRLVAVIGH